VNHVAKEVHEQPQEVVTVDVVADAQGFPGEPHNTSVFMEYVHHVPTTVWNGEVFIF